MPQTAGYTVQSPTQDWQNIASARLFLSTPVTAGARATLRGAINHFPQLIEQILPEERWHLTLAFLGEIEYPQQYLSRLLKPLPQSFVPTVTITHVGRGLQRLQLWAYAHPSTILLNVRTQLLDRMRSMRLPYSRKGIDTYIPHIHLANLWPMARGLGIADYGIPMTYTIPEIHLWQSVHVPNERATYILRGKILVGN